MSMKEAYEKKFQAQLAEWNAEIDKFKAKAEAAQGDAQLQYEKKIAELRDMQEETAGKFRAFTNASDDAWKDMKTGMDAAWDTFENAMKSAASRFK
ncbi:hypothetical protein [Kiloniella laminariae]|uniref:hypothetical protein n=1 Tax=Kiloniella laminariae TaxID=454162 RepID=UPI00037ECFA8|nr:hypothetical protein [Kiloniella laminariae]